MATPVTGFGHGGHAEDRVFAHFGLILSVHIALGGEVHRLAVPGNCGDSAADMLIFHIPRHHVVDASKALRRESYRLWANSCLGKARGAKRQP